MNIEECYRNFSNHIIEYYIRTEKSVVAISKESGVPRLNLISISYKSSLDSVTLEDFLKLCNYLDVSPNEMISPVQNKSPAEK